MLFEPLKPMLLTSCDAPFDDNDWIHEPKLDGWRVLIHKQGERVEAFTRHGMRITDRFPELSEVNHVIRSHEAILDCEGVCYRDGKTVLEDFSYRGRLGQKQKVVQAARTKPASFVVFDVLYDGHDRTRLPLMDRKERLAEIVQSNSVLSPVTYVDGDGVSLFNWIELNDWEGITSKKKTSRYHVRLDTTDGFRSPEWVKVKAWRYMDTVLMGYRFKPSFAILVGAYFGERLRLVATVELGINQEYKKVIREVSRSIGMKRTETVQWIEPAICVRVKYRAKTEHNRLRMAVFSDFLLDRKPDQCHWI